MDAPDYYKLRLEHTIQHLQQATRLIYFVSGGVIAMFYFVVDKMRDSPAQRNFGVGLLLLLGLVNAIHALLIQVQAKWYKAFDAKLAESVQAEMVTRGKVWVSAGGLWIALHWVVALSAFAGAAYVLCSGITF